MPRQDDPWSEIPDDEPRQELIRQQSVNPALRPADPDLAGMLKAIQQASQDIVAAEDRREKRDRSDRSLRRVAVGSLVGTVIAIVVGDLAGWVTQFMVFVGRGISTFRLPPWWNGPPP